MSNVFHKLLHAVELPLQNPVLVFSLLLFITLLSPILLRKANIPGIIGLIISGVVIGPHGLNILEKSSAIELFSTIGLLYIMFIAGLELDMSEFKTNRNKSLLFGFFTFIIPLAIGFPVIYYFLGYSLNASLLTASMFATHTLVAYPIVSKLGLAKNQAVAVAVGGTILTDTAVLIILAIILGNNQGNLGATFWINLTLSLAVFSAIMFLLIPRIATWFFSRLETEKHAHYIFVLSVLFFAAFLAELAGVEAIIGAFVAGLALNKIIPHSSVLMNRIEFIGSSLFIPIFLISVGMLVDVRVIMNSPKALIIALTLTTIALLGKWLAAYFTQIALAYNAFQRKLIFGLSSAHAAATLAIILVGFKANIIDENILNGTIILILITCVVASFATEKASKKILISQEIEENSRKFIAANKTEQILIPVANLEKIERLLEFAFFIKNKKSFAPISILSVVSNDDEAESNVLKAKTKLNEFVRQVSSTEVNVNIIATLDYNAVSGITRISKEIMATEIVLGWPQKAGLLDRLIGEKVDNIINATQKTTYICHIQQPLIWHKRLFLIVPPLAEREEGFEAWFVKIALLAKEVASPIALYSSQPSADMLLRLVKSRQLGVILKHVVFDDWGELKSLDKSIRSTDLIVLINARKSAVSYEPFLANLASKLARRFNANSIIAVFPRHLAQNYMIEPAN